MRDKKNLRINVALEERTETLKSDGTGFASSQCYLVVVEPLASCFVSLNLFFNLRNGDKNNSKFCQN